MKRNVILVCAIFLLLCPGVSRAFGDPIPSLQELSLNINGTFLDSLAPVFISTPGLDTSAFDLTTGLGTLTYTYNPGVAGPAFFDIFVDEEVGVPFFNEFGTKVGSPGGTSWEIGDNLASSIFANTQNNALSNTNELPQGNDNFLT